MIRHPGVSVLLPVHNGERFLTSAVESILSQSFRDFELIAIDDGSTDASLAVLEGYAAVDARIILVSREQRGLVDTLNEGIEIARAPFIARMDADDIAFPERLERQVDFLQENIDCVAVGSAVQVIDSEGKVTREISVETQHEEIDRCNMLGAAFGIPHPSAMMRRDALVELGGYRNEFPVAQDVDLFLRLAERGRVANLPDVLLAYRVHGENVSQRRRQVQTACAERAILEAYQRRGQNIPCELCLQLSRWALETERLWHARGWASAALRRDLRNRTCWHLLALAWFPLRRSNSLPSWLDPVRLASSAFRRGLYLMGNTFSRS